jgi:uncharacterized protein YecT (DUF1311 family)
MRKLALVAFVVMVAVGCGSTTLVSSHKPLPRPSLPTRPYPGSPPCRRHGEAPLDYAECAYRRTLVLNAKFNRAVRALWTKLDHTSRQEFARGQRAWNAYVARECDVARREFVGGSEAQVSVAYCEEGLTRARVKEVSGMLASYSQG